MDYRHVTDDELFLEYLGYAFSPQRGPDRELDEDAPDPPRESRGLFPDGEDRPASVAAYYEFDARIRDMTVVTGGISAVATPPEHRREGYVRSLLREMVHELRADDIPFSALWPFKHSFYRRLGWATAHRLYQVEAPPEALRAAAIDETGRWRRADADDWPLLDAVHGTQRHELAVDRTEAWWREMVFRSWRGTPYAYLHETDGEPDAYVVYRVVDDDGRRLEISDAAAREEAFGHVLRFLADHDSQVETVRLHRQTPDLLDEVEDPASLDVEVHAGGMVRPMDVSTTLEAIRYPANVTAAVILHIEDPLAVADCTVELSVGDGTARVSAASGQEPDAVLGVGTLGQLVVGYRRADGLIPDAPAVTRETLGAVFPVSDPFLGEAF